MPYAKQAYPEVQHLTSSFQGNMHLSDTATEWGQVSNRLIKLP